MAADPQKSSTSSTTGLTEVIATAPPTHRLDYARRNLSSFSRWVRRKFSKESLFEGFKTLAWVVPLTVLIWVYAEREQVLQVRDFPVPIELKSADPGRVVTFQHFDKNLMVDVSGPRAAIDHIRESFGREVPAVMLTIDRTYAPGRAYPIELARLLSQTDIFRSRGVIVTASNPSQINVFVDQIAEKQLDVEAGDESNLASKPIFDPPKVTIRGPQSALDKVEHVTAELTGLEALKAGESHDIPAVRVTTNDPSLTITPSTVKATVNVREADIEYVIGALPVWISQPGGSQLEVTFQPVTLTNVKVIGPPDRIELLKQPDLQPKPKVTVEVSSRDVTPGVSKELPVHYSLPEGVRPAPDEEQRKVTVTATKRGEG